MTACWILTTMVCMAAVTPVSPFATLDQQAAVPPQWQTFDNQPQAMPPGQFRQQAAWAQQATGHGQHQQPQGQQLWEQGQGQLQQQPLWQGQQQQQPWSQQGQGEPQQQVPWGHNQGPFHEVAAAGQEQTQQAAQRPESIPQGLPQQQPLWSGQTLREDPWPEGQMQGHNQAQHQPPWVQGQIPQPSQGQGHNQPSWAQPPGHSQGMQEPLGQLRGAPSGVPLEHRSRTMRTTSFRQVVRSASEGDAMALQAQPATALQVPLPHLAPTLQPTPHKHAMFHASN